MSETIQFYVLIVVLTGAFSIGLYRFKIIDRAASLVILLLGLGILSESIGYYCSIKFHTDILVYNCYGIIEFFIFCLYYNLIIGAFNKRKMGLYFGLFGVIGGVLNMAFLQSPLRINTNFLYFEGFCITAMSLFAFYKFVLNNEELVVTHYPHFWFTSIFLFSWNISIINWGTYDSLRVKFPGIDAGLNFFIWLIDILSYLAIGIVFLFYPQMQAKDE